MKKSFLLFFLISFQAFSITRDVRYLKVRDSHLIFDDKLFAKEVVITFSGKINAPILEKIIKRLDEEELKAHFFIPGDSATENPELVLKLANRGHLIGSQGLTPQRTKEGGTSEQALLAEIQTGHEAVFATLGYVYPFIRLAPRQGGFAVRDLIKESGAFAFYWNIDYYPENPDQSMRENLKREDYRGIVALPVNRESALVALDALIEEIKREDLTVIAILPNEESPWLDHPPLIRRTVKEEILKNGSLIERKKC